MSGPDSVYVTDSPVNPSDEVDVSVQLIAPFHPGKYVGYWRLVEPSGKKFGQRVRVQIHVGTGKSMGEKDIFRIEQPTLGMLLAQLDRMGFKDKKKNIKALKKHRGNMEAAIVHLLTKQQKHSVRDGGD